MPARQRVAGSHGERFSSPWALYLDESSPRRIVKDEFVEATPFSPADQEGTHDELDAVTERSLLIVENKGNPD
jgi:hypothetical protein